MHNDALKQTGRFVLFLAIGVFCAWAGACCINISLAEMFSSLTTDITALFMFAMFFFTPWSIALIKRLMGGVTVFGGAVLLIFAILFLVLLNILAGWALFLWDFGKVIYSWVKAFAHRNEEL